MPARSIGSQIAIIPSTPQPSSPLASIGQGSTAEIDPPFSGPESSGVIDVSHDIEPTRPSAPYEPPAPEDSSVDVNVDHQPDPPTRPRDESPPHLDQDEPTTSRETTATTDPVDSPDVSYQIPDTVTPPDDFLVQSRYGGPMDMDVIAAGGNPVMAKRTDLTHEEKMAIAKRVTEERRSDRDQRKDSYDQRHDQPPQPQPQPQPQGTDGLGNLFATSLDGAPVDGRHNISPFSAPGPTGKPIGDPLAYGESPADVTAAFTAATAAIDQYADVIGMIIEAIARLTAANAAHHARISAILDRLDSDPNTNEYGEMGSTWLG